MPPTSVAEALSRLRTLEVEIKEIEGQVANPTRLSLYSKSEDYDEWKAKAKRARAYLMQEAQLLREYASQHPAEADLLREAHELLARLVEEGVDFDEDEHDLIKRIGEHHGVATRGEERSYRDVFQAGDRRRAVPIKCRTKRRGEVT